MPSSWLAKPMLGSKISRHIMPTATGVATSGSRMATRTHFSPRNGRHSSSAIAMPRTTSQTRATPVKHSVRPTAGQKRSVSDEDRRGSSAKPTNSDAARTEPCESVRLR